MFRMKNYVFTTLLLVSSLTSYCQDYKGELKIGDRLPVGEINNMVNYPAKTLKFGDHKPKLTILDIWSTTCGGCVTAWPKMLSLQKEFGKDLQIILVNRSEDERIVKDFVALRKKLINVDMNLPISCKDTTFKRLFPRRGVPRYYWIDSNGVLASATHGEQVTRANIRKWIESGPFPMEQIYEDILLVEHNKPIFVDGNGGTGRAGAFIWSSSLTKSMPDIMGVSGDFADPIRGYGICKTGSTIDGLYRTAYNNRLDPGDVLTYIHSSRRELIAKDSSRYLGLEDGVTTRSRRYNYQLIAGRPMNREQLQEIMRQDLDRYFGLKATWEKRRKPCLVITMFDSAKAQAKTRGEYNRIVGETATAIDNATMHSVVYFMEQGSFFYDPRPIIDETGFKGLLTGIYFKANSADLKALDAGFSKFGINIKEEIREVDVLVLREAEGANP